MFGLSIPSVNYHMSGLACQVALMLPQTGPSDCTWDFACRFGGTPLWPLPQQPQAPPCEACGAPRLFELQTMPALYAALSEGLAWQHDSGGDGGIGGGISIDAWRWLTIAIFSCSKSCGPAPGCTVTEEHVVLANE